MAIFQSISSEIDKPDYKIKIANFEVSNDHFGSEHQIYQLMGKIEEYLYSSFNVEDDILLFALELAKTNRRIVDGGFYRDGKKLIFLITTKNTNFKNPKIGTREINIAFKKKALSFSIIEIVEEEAEEVKGGKKKLPSKWKFEEKLTTRYNKFKHFI